MDDVGKFVVGNICFFYDGINCCVEGEGVCFVGMLIVWDVKIGKVILLLGIKMVDCLYGLGKEIVLVDGDIEICCIVWVWVDCILGNGKIIIGFINGFI